MNKKSILNVAMFALIFFLALQLFAGKSKTPPPELVSGPLGIMASSDSFVDGAEVKVTLKNNTQAPITLPSNCPANPLRVLKSTGTAFEEIKAETALPSCEGMTEILVPANEEYSVSYKLWNHALFATPGRYKVETTITQEGKEITATSPEFTIEEAGVLRKFFRAAFYQPIYNLMIFFIKIVPAHDLGLGIILLTILIRLILLVPSQRAIVSQRRMQELQPKLDAIKKEFQGNQERIAQETMKLWKQHKVNPFGSCLPLIIQFPFLIAIFYAIQNGLNSDNAYLLYSTLQNFNFSDIHTNFLGILELRKIDPYVMPVLIGLLQFAQLKLTMARNKKKNEHKEHKDGEKKPSTEMEAANKMMIYIMPVMIGVFTASLPAGVGLYWGISTLFAIVQQLVANRKSLTALTH